MKKNTIKRALATAAAFLLAVTIGGGNPLTVKAEDPTTYSITVRNENSSISISGKTYYAHKLFDATYDSNNHVAYTISEENPYFTNTNTKNILDEYFDFSNDGTTRVVTVKSSKLDPDTHTTLSSSDARALADALQPYITDAETDPYVTVPTNAEEATITVPSAGYYIVTGTAAAKETTSTTKEIVTGISLTTANPSATINPKAEVPTLDKKITGVKEGSNSVNDAVLDEQGRAAVAKVGSTVSFELDSKVPDTTGYTTYTYKITDTLSAGLDFVSTQSDLSNLVVKINGTIKTAATDYDVTFNGKALTITIHSDVIKDAEKGQNIVVTYDATVNQESLSHDFESNTANLQYSNNPKDSTQTNITPDEKTYVVNLNLNIEKVDASNHDTKLPGAKFKLYRTGNDSNEYYKWDETTGKVTWVNDASVADEFETNNEGKLKQVIRGLDKGTYYLEETVAPEGYNKLQEPIKVEISATEEVEGSTVTYKYRVKDSAEEKTAETNGTITLGAEQTTKHASATITVENGAGHLLPSTGGIGTTIFYVAGGILIIGAAVLLINRKKATNN